MVKLLKLAKMVGVMNEAGNAYSPSGASGDYID